MALTDLPCDSEPPAPQDVIEGSALRQVLHAAQRYGSQPTDRDAYATLLLVYAIRLASHRMGRQSTAGVCLRALEREP